MTTLVPVCKFSAHNTYITRVLLSPDVHHLATCSADHTARIWAVDTSFTSSTDSSALLMPTSSAPSASTNVNITETVKLPPPQQQQVANQTNGIGDSEGFPLEMTLQGHQRWVWDCAFSADSAYLVTACSDHYARLWELSTQSIIRQYNGHHRGAVCVALNDTADP